MPDLPVLFIDDGGLLNDNALRAPEWQRLIGEYFPPRCTVQKLRSFAHGTEH